MADRWLDEGARRVAAAAVAAAALGWWPAFTLGVYGVIFFEQLLALWAAATTAFLTVGLARGARMWRRPIVWTLLLPSLWLLLGWLVPVGGTSGIYQVVFWLGVAVTVVGMPALAAFMTRMLIPGAERLRGRDASIAVGAVLVVMVTAYALGSHHPRFLTCQDFTISGNYAPQNCSPGRGLSVR